MPFMLYAYMLHGVIVLGDELTYGGEMGKIKIEGEDIENLGLTLVDEDDDTVDPDDMEALTADDIDDAAIIEVIAVTPPAIDVLPDHPVAIEDIEEDLLSQLEAILSPRSLAHEDESEDTPVSTRRSVKKKNDDDEEAEDESLGAVKPRQKDEVHCGRCYILVKATIVRCPVDDDSCPVVCGGKS